MKAKLSLIIYEQNCKSDTDTLSCNKIECYERNTESYLAQWKILCDSWGVECLVGALS